MSARVRGGPGPRRGRVAVARAALPVVLLAVAGLLTLSGAEPLPAQEYPGAGDGRMYIGTYNDAMYVLSESTGEVVDRIVMETGIPRDAVLSHDGERLYVLNIDYERIEVVDIASKETLDVFSLSREGETIRVWTYTVSPDERWAVFVVRRDRRLVDRWEVGDLELLVYDLQAHEVVAEPAWPGGEPAFFLPMRFSPDGRLLYFFTDQVHVYETDGFTEVERWAYERALDEGMGPFRFGFPDSPYEEEGYFTGLFRTEEPVNERELLGVARVDLAGRRADFFPVGPSEDLSFTLGPDGRGYGLHNEIGDYQLWTFDLEERSLVERTRIEGRPRMRLEASSNGEYLYVWQAGNTIDLLDPETGRYVYTIELDADTTTDLIVVPDDEAAAAADGEG